MKEITVKELLEKRRVLEKEVNSLLRNFELETGVNINNVYNHRGITEDEVSKEFSRAPKVYISLDL